MGVFQYPKTKHVRKFEPPANRPYRYYKQYLQREFARICVYCRWPDSIDPTTHFGVDHYRPKSNPVFAVLANSYGNLFYCCSSCNTRKSDYWPHPGSDGPYVVNPCDSVMADHLRFSSSTGSTEGRSSNGRFHVELLQLDGELTSKARLRVLKTIELHESEVASLMAMKKRLVKKRKAGAVSPEAAEEGMARLDSEIALNEDCIAHLTGQKSLPEI